MPSMEATPLDFSRLFNSSFERLSADDINEFYRRFYTVFVAASPQVKAVFAQTDMDRQVDMLKLSLMQMVAFAANRCSNDYLNRVASKHAQLGIDASLFSLWEECLLQVVRERDPQYDARVELAWRVTLAPGLAFMRTFGALSH
jgi:hemoglobin-like flavoprotein